MWLLVWMDAVDWQSHKRKKFKSVTYCVVDERQWGVGLGHELSLRCHQHNAIAQASFLRKFVEFSLRLVLQLVGCLLCQPHGQQCIHYVDGEVPVIIVWDGDHMMMPMME